MRIYADYAATTPMHPKAIEAMSQAMSNLYGNPSSLHSVGQDAAQALSDARGTIAKHLNCQPKEVYFTSGGSEADNQAIVSAALMGARKNKRHLIATTIEHHAVLHTLRHLETQGYRVTLLPVDGDGQVSVKQVADAICEDTCLISVMAANNEIGTLQPIGEIGALCRERRIFFHTDAVQVVGHMPVDVQAQSIDLLSLAAHKFGGPKGVGVLYARQGVMITPLIHGGAQERGRRGGTENVPAIVATAVALDLACQSMAQEAISVGARRDALMEGLLKIPHSVLNGHPTNRLYSNVNICFEGIEGESLLLLLDAKGVQASSGSACTSGDLDPSHVLLAIGRPHEIAHGSLRLSLGADTTQEEIEYIIQTVGDVVGYLRGISPVWTDLQKGVTPYVIQ